MLRRLTLPDGLEVFSVNADETRFVHLEVFVARCYLQHGMVLQDGDCVFDVGANIGLATVFFHRERRNVRIFAFEPDRKSTRLNSSHLGISYAVFCLKKTNTL